MLFTDAPPAWEAAPPTSFMEIFLLFVIAPVALVALVALAASARTISGGDRQRPGTGGEVGISFGELERTEARALTTGPAGTESTGTPPATGDTGGASARW